MPIRPAFASAVAALVVVASAAAITACAGPSSVEIEALPPEASPRSAKETPRCDDGVPNGAETDTDCGGPCGKCELAQGCKGDVDCATGVCRDGLCAGPSSANGARDADETDVDCGGAAAPACAVGARCAADSDCESSSCVGGRCAVALESGGADSAGGGAGAKNVGAPGAASVPANAKSCAGGGAGRATCGSAGNESCCTTIAVPAGSYNRYKNAALPAKVSAFNLDKYEITQGRLRAFFAASGGNLRGNPPAAGAGAHPKIASSGWRSEWNKRLPGSYAEIQGRLVDGCAFGSDNASYGSTTWTTGGGNDDKPVTCIDWYTLFAFCAWDGGRLPTDAEWGYAAMGGADQRTYTWGNAAPHADDPTGYSRVVHYLDGWQMSWPLSPPASNADWNAADGPKHIAPPGKKPAGKAKWGHMDLNGNVLEWMLDSNDAPTGTCNDCANVAWPKLAAGETSPYPLKADGTPAWASDGGRVLRGGSFEEHPLQNTHRFKNYPVWRTYARAGGRCARD